MLAHTQTFSFLILFFTKCLLRQYFDWNSLKYFFFFSKQLSLLFAQGQLLQALRSQDFQKGQGGGEPSCVPGMARSILLPAGVGRVDKVYHQVSLQFCVGVSCSVMSNSVTSWTVAHQAPLSKGFSRKEYWSGLPFPSPWSKLLTQST